MTKTILVVDDNDEERMVFSAYLRFIGGEVLEASDGEEGVRLAREYAPDLVLLDIRMPGTDGWDALGRLKADPQTARIPVLAITAHRLESEQAERAGFSGYLEKPLSPHRIVEEVERRVGPMHERRTAAREPERGAAWLSLGGSPTAL